MNITLIVLIILYTLVPALFLSQTLRRIRSTKEDSKANLDAWLVHNLATFLIALSFLPLLSWPVIALPIFPLANLSIAAFIMSFVLIALTVRPATSKNQLPFYVGGVKAAIFEEILFRGVLFSLLLALTNNIWTTVIINSILFGLWHLKNIPWSGTKRAIPQALYTGFIAGPIFNLLLVFTGDIYLPILAHLIHNIVLTFFRKQKK